MYKRLLVVVTVLVLFVVTLNMSFIVESPSQCGFHIIATDELAPRFIYTDPDLYVEVAEKWHEAVKELNSGHYIDPLNVVGCIPGVHVITNHSARSIGLITNMVRDVHVEHYIDKGHASDVIVDEDDVISQKCWCGYRRRITESKPRPVVYYDALIHCDQCGCKISVVIENTKATRAIRRGK